MLSLLDALANHSTAVSLKQLAQETSLHPSTAHRILNAMVHDRFVERVEPGTYRLGMRLLELGMLVRLRIGIRQTALPFMHQLHQELGETVNLSIRQSDEVVYVERTSSGTQLMKVVQIGARAPLHITAVGKVFLAVDGVDKCRAYAERTGLPKFTENTITEPARLVKEIEAARDQGYAFDNEEAEKGVSCIGAGIYSDEGQLFAGLSLSAPIERFNRAWAPQVKLTAERISRAMGHHVQVRP